MGAPDAFRSVSDSTRATLTVERFGQVTDYTIDAGLAGTSETEVAPTPDISNTATR